MMGLHLSRRARLGLLGVLIAALVLLFPMRLAFGMMGLDRYGIAARGVYGSIWWGGVEQLSIGDVPVGSVGAALSPVQILVARARVDVWRRNGLANDIAGALTAGIGRVGIDDASGTLPLGAKLAPLPISSLTLKDVSARFTGGACGHAEGHVRAMISTPIPGIDLSQGLAGDVRCDGRDMLLPLASQSGREKLNLRVTPAGRYSVEMIVATTDPALEQALAANGFRRLGNEHRLRLEGAL